MLDMTKEQFDKQIEELPEGFEMEYFFMEDGKLNVLVNDKIELRYYRLATDGVNPSTVDEITMGEYLAKIFCQRIAGSMMLTMEEVREVLA